MKNIGVGAAPSAGRGAASSPGRRGRRARVLLGARRQREMQNFPLARRAVPQHPVLDFDRTTLLFGRADGFMRVPAATSFADVIRANNNQGDGVRTGHRRRCVDTTHARELVERPGTGVSRCSHPTLAAPPRASGRHLGDPVRIHAGLRHLEPRAVRRVQPTSESPPAPDDGPDIETRQDGRHPVNTAVWMSSSVQSPQCFPHIEPQLFLSQTRTRGSNSWSVYQGPPLTSASVLSHTPCRASWSSVVLNVQFSLIYSQVLSELLFQVVLHRGRGLDVSQPHARTCRLSQRQTNRCSLVNSPSLAASISGIHWCSEASSDPRPAATPCGPVDQVVESPAGRRTRPERVFYSCSLLTRRAEAVVVFQHLL